MSSIEHIRLLADYNRWMNEKIYAAAERLTPEAVWADRGAFFGSIGGTLEHLVVGDTIWLKRFAAHPAARSTLAGVVALADPKGLADVQFGELGLLRARRRLLDEAMIAWAAGLSDRDLDAPLSYRNTKGVAATRSHGLLIQHLFNHQAHHRGQVTTLLSQAGEDVGETDLLALIPSL